VFAVFAAAEISGQEQINLDQLQIIIVSECRRQQINRSSCAYLSA
jgi:hypothetical protein